MTVLNARAPSLVAQTLLYKHFYTEPPGEAIFVALDGHLQCTAVPLNGSQTMARLDSMASETPSSARPCKRRHHLLQHSERDSRRCTGRLHDFTTCMRLVRESTLGICHTCWELDLWCTLCWAMDRHAPLKVAFSSSVIFVFLARCFTIPATVL